MTRLLFVCQAAIATCVIGMMLPAVARSQTVLKLSPSSQTSQTADSDWATVRDDAPTATDHVRIPAADLGGVVRWRDGGTGARAGSGRHGTRADFRHAGTRADFRRRGTRGDTRRAASEDGFRPGSNARDPLAADGALAAEKAGGQAPPAALPPLPGLAAPVDAGAGPMVGPFEILDKVEPLNVMLRRSKLLRHES